jgi:hypothetical protein
MHGLVAEQAGWVGWPSSTQVFGSLKAEDWLLKISEIMKILLWTRVLERNHVSWCQAMMEFCHTLMYLQWWCLPSVWSVSIFLILAFRFWGSWEAAYQYIPGSLELLCWAVAEVSLASFCWEFYYNGFLSLWLQQTSLWSPTCTTCSPNLE